MARGRRPNDWRLESSFPLAQMLGKGQDGIKEEGVPDFFTEFLPNVQIESDNPIKPGAIPFVPFDFQKELFETWLEGKSVVWLKRRQIGASWMMCAFAYWKAAYNDSTHVALISAGQREADELMRKIRYIDARLPLHLRRKYHGGVQRLEFSTSASLVIAFPSTENSGISFRFSLIIQDEAAFHPYAAQNYGAFRPAIDAGGQLLITSTADPRLGESGFIYDIWKQAISGDVPYLPVFTDRMARPDQQEEWWTETEKAYSGQDDARDAFYPRNWQEAFVGKSGLALPAFSEARNVRPDDPMEWGEYDYRIASVDPGGGDPTAVVLNGVWRDRQTGVIRFHQPKGGEFYRRDPVDIDQIIAYLSKQEPLDRVWVDTAGGTVLLTTLRRYGFNAWPALKDRALGLGLYNQVLAEGRLTHHVDNKETIAEYSQYRLLSRIDPNDRTRYRTSTPVDNHADAKDCERYNLLGFRNQIEAAAAGRPSSPMKLVWSA